MPEKGWPHARGSSERCLLASIARRAEDADVGEVEGAASPGERVSVVPRELAWSDGMGRALPPGADPSVQAHPRGDRLGADASPTGVAIDGVRGAPGWMVRASTPSVGELPANGAYPAHLHDGQRRAAGVGSSFGHLRSDPVDDPRLVISKLGREPEVGAAVASCDEDADHSLAGAAVDRHATALARAAHVARSPAEANAEILGLDPHAELPSQAAEHTTRSTAGGRRRVAPVSRDVTAGSRGR